MVRASWLVAAVLWSPPVHADRPIHGSVGAGGSLLATGNGGDRGRLDVIAELTPRSRFGALAAWRAFDENHAGLITAGLVYEAGAARPRLVLDLDAVAGFDLDARRPLAGGGIRATLAIIGPLGIALDSTAHLVIDGIDTRLQLATGALIVGRW